MAYRADVIESALLNDGKQLLKKNTFSNRCSQWFLLKARAYAQPGEQKIKSLDQLFNMIDNSYSNMVRNIGDLIRHSEKRSQCRIFNARINDYRTKFEWPPNDQGIIFGRLPNGDPDPNVVAPDSLDDYRRQVNHAMLNAIMQHYGIGKIPNEKLENKSKRVLTYLGLFPFYYI